jgi:hypothetical protein
MRQLQETEKRVMSKVRILSADAHMLPCVIQQLLLSLPVHIHSALAVLVCNVGNALQGLGGIRQHMWQVGKAWHGPVS